MNQLVTDHEKRYMTQNVGGGCRLQGHVVGLIEESGSRKVRVIPCDPAE
jgi:hypothetical protein